MTDALQTKVVTGRVHSIQSMGTVDGPGVRFVVFMQGCPLRCGCCHNPDTWDLKGGKEYTPCEIIERAKRCREYFGRDGGITLSGGEPLLQPEFAKELFSLAKSEGINTCLDTSGVILNDSVKTLLSVTDRVLLDIKYTADELYRRNVGCSIDAPLLFLEYLNGIKLPTTLRQVIIPTLNDTEENISELRKIRDTHACVDTVELLPFRKICETKYKALGIPFPDSHIPEPTHKRMEELYALLDL